MKSCMYIPEVKLWQLLQTGISFNKLTESGTAVPEKKLYSDWKEELDKEIQRLDDLEEKILEMIETRKDAARRFGGQYADKP